MQILGQHILVKAAIRQSPAGISAGEVLVGPARSIEVASGGNVEDTAADSEVDGGVLEAVVGGKGWRGEGAEDGCGRRRGQGGFGDGLEVAVGDEEEEGEEEQVYGCQE